MTTFMLSNCRSHTRLAGPWQRTMSVVLLVTLALPMVGATTLAGAGDGRSSASAQQSGLVPHAAQTGDATPDQAPVASPAPGASTPIEQWPGLVDAVSRTYSSTTPPPNAPDLVTLDVAIYQFDGASDAATSYDLLVASTTSDFQMQADLTPSQSVVTGTVDGVGERADMVRLDDLFEGGYHLQEYVLTLDGTYVFAVMSVVGGPLLSDDATPSISETASPLLIELATSLVETGQPAAEAAKFYQDGTSTGGLWGFMPETGDPLLMGLVPLMDFVVYPHPTL